MQLVQKNPLGSLVRGILTDLRELILEEVALARVEIREQAGRARTAAMSLGAAIVALAFGGIFLLIALAFGLLGAYASLRSASSESTPVTAIVVTPNFSSA